MFHYCLDTNLNKKILEKITSFTVFEVFLDDRLMTHPQYTSPSTISNWDRLQQPPWPYKGLHGFWRNMDRLMVEKDDSMFPSFFDRCLVSAAVCGFDLVSLIQVLSRYVIFAKPDPPTCGVGHVGESWCLYSQRWFKALTKSLFTSLISLVSTEHLCGSYATEEPFSYKSKPLVNEFYKLCAMNYNATITGKDRFTS